MLGEFARKTASMHYESWFQFRSRPFSTAPRLEDYFPAECIESSRITVTNCIQRGAGPTLIVGPCGIGKTMLCQRLADEFRPLTDVALVSGTGMTTRRAMWQSILFELRLPFRQMEVGELRLSLIDHLSSQAADYPGLVLVIDDAHSVPSRLLEEVRMLSNLVRDGNWRVHLVLAGKQTLEEHLALPRMESFNQRIVARCYLKRFTHPETLAYVRHQFARAGIDAAAIVTEGGLDCVHEISHGVVRLINQLCDHALVMAWVDGQRQLTEASVREAWRDLQQLPLTDSTAAPQTVEDSTVVEFGSLDDDEPVPQRSPETSAADEILEPESSLQPHRSGIASPPIVSPETESLEIALEDPESQLATIQEQISDVNDGDRPEVHPADQYPLVDFPVPQIASDPFQEFFEEEEIVVHDFGTLRAPAVQTHAQVTTEEGKHFRVDGDAAHT